MGIEGWKATRVYTAVGDLILIRNNIQCKCQKRPKLNHIGRR